MNLFGIINDRHVNFSKTANNGWSLAIYTKDEPPSQTAIDIYAINSYGAFNSAGETRTYDCSGSMCQETGFQRRSFGKEERISKSALADRILSELSDQLTA
jgi:hypothetical protein